MTEWMDRLWLTTADVAPLFEMSEATIRRRARQHNLPHMLSPGGQYRFDADEIRHLIEVRRVRLDWRMVVSNARSDSLSVEGMMAYPHGSGPMKETSSHVSPPSVVRAQKGLPSRPSALAAVANIRH